MALTLNGSTGLSGIVGSAATPALQGTDTNTGYFFGTDILGLSTAGSERLRITAAGNLALGNDGSFPIYTDTNDRNFILGTGSDDAAIQLHSGTDKFGGLYFGDATSGADRYNGYVEYKHNDNYLRFATGGTEKLRITSGGNLGLGTGSNIDERVHFENAGNITLLVECSTSGGGSNSAIRLKSADSSSDWYMQTGNAVDGGLRFYSGAEKVRMLSGGGITFNGDTAAANALNDYEEGTYTPVITCATSGGYNLNSSYYTMAYRKIGSFIHIQGYISVVSESGTPNGALRITLPKTATALTQNADYTGIKILVRNHGSSNIYNQVAVTHGDGAYFNILFDDGNGASTYMTHAHVDTEWQFFISGGYIGYD